MTRHRLTPATAALGILLTVASPAAAASTDADDAIVVAYIPVEGPAATDGEAGRAPARVTPVVTDDAAETSTSGVSSALVIASLATGSAAAAAALYASTLGRRRRRVAHA